MVIDYSTTIPPASLNAVSSRDNAKDNRAVMNESQAHCEVALCATIGSTNMVLTPYLAGNGNEAVNGVHTDPAANTSANSLVNRTLTRVNDGTPKNPSRRPINLTQGLMFGDNYGSTVDAGDWETITSLNGVLDKVVWEAIIDEVVAIKVPSRAKESINQTISGLKFITDGLLSERAFKSTKEWAARHLPSIAKGDYLPVWEDCVDLDTIDITLNAKMANELGIEKGKTTVGAVIDAASALVKWTPFGESDGEDRGTNPLAGLRSADA